MPSLIRALQIKVRKWRGEQHKGDDPMKIAFLSLALIVILWSATPWRGANRATGSPETRPSAATTQPGETHETLPVAPLELLAKVQRGLRTIKSVEAKFVEKRHVAVVDHNVTIEGRFGIEKPDRMIWVVREPSRYAVRLRGEELSQWDEETKEVQIVHLRGDPAFKAVSGQIQAWFLGNYQALAQSWDVYVVSEKPLPLSLRFVPKATTYVAKHMKYIEATFNQDWTNIDSMRVSETGGDQATFTFSDVQLNRTIDQKTWEIPPK